MSGYSPLDDVPFQVRRAIQAQASPTPTHFSMVTNSPSPESSSRAVINQQVMSPNTQPASITATASVMQQRVLQLQIPPGMLQELQQSAALDAALVSDMRAAFQELHDRMYHRTGLLGTAANALQDGYNAVVQEIQRLQNVVDSDTGALETLVSTNSPLRRELDELHSTLQSTVRETSQMRMGQLQWQSQVEAHIAMLEGQLAAVRDEQIQLKKADELFHDCTDPSAGVDAVTRAAIESIAGRVSRLEEVTKTALQSTEDAQRDLLGMHDAVNAVNDRQEQLAVQFDQLQSDAKTPRNKPQTEVATANDPAPSKVSVVKMTPGAPNSVEEVEKTQDMFDHPPNLWDSGLDWPDAGMSGVTFAAEWPAFGEPPGLPARLSKPSDTNQEESGRPKRVSAGLAKDLDGSGSASSGGGISIPNARWKCLLDVPPFDPKEGAGSPWELGLRLEVWKRQFLTLASTVSPEFSDYVSKCFLKAQERHDQQARGDVLGPIEAVRGFPAEFESRLVVVMLRVLTDEVKTPALEADEGSEGIRSQRLLEELFLQVRPGGLEEQQTLVKFLRSLNPADTARDAIDILRR